MSDVTYRLSLTFKGTTKPVRGFSVSVKPLEGGPPVWGEKQLHHGTNDSLEVILDSDQIPNGAKMRLRGPVTGNEKHPVNYDFEVLLRAKTGGNIDLLFEDCPLIETFLHSETPPSADSDDQKLISVQQDVIEGSEAIVLANNSPLSGADWLPDLDLDCIKLHVRIAHTPETAGKQYMMKLRHHDTPHALVADIPISADFKNPTIIPTRMTNATVKLHFWDVQHSQETMEVRLNLETPNDQDVLLVPVSPKAVPHSKKKTHYQMVEMTGQIPGPTGKREPPMIDWVQPFNDSHALRRAQFANKVKEVATEVGLDWIEKKHSTSTNRKVESFFDNRLGYFLIVQHGGPNQDTNTNAKRWIFPSGNAGKFLEHQVRVDRILVSFEE